MAWVAAMKMTVADWRDRASDCMMAARRASTPHAQLQWLILSDAWHKFAELRERGQSIFIEKPLSGSISATAGRSSAVVESGNQLRARLLLVTNNDAP